MAAISQKNIFKYIFLKKNMWILIKISLKFVSKGVITYTGSDNGLAPTRRQAIIRTDDV